MDKTVIVSKIREIFAILSQGVELYHFFRTSRGKSKRAKRVVWLVILFHYALCLGLCFIILLIHILFL